MQSLTNPSPESGSDQPRTYDQWKARALERDEISGAARWRQVEFSRRYDYTFIRERLDDLPAAMKSHDPHHLRYHLSEGVHGNIAGIGSPNLYGHAVFGTKNLITTYIEETAEAVKQLAKTDDAITSPAQKRDFLRHASECFGRTALMLSGAGALGPFHLGVVKAWFEQDLLPNVVSGASAGALVCAVIGTRDDETIAATLDSRSIASSFSGLVETNGGDRRRRLGIDAVRSLVESQIPDVTFSEAFELTGRRINISVSPLKTKQRSRMLNAITTPHVLIREAVLASCAIPGVFPPVRLKARNFRGVNRPGIFGGSRNGSVWPRNSEHLSLVKRHNGVGDVYGNEEEVITGVRTRSR